MYRWILLVGVLSACQAERDFSTIKTDLGRVGNELVRDTFEQYLAKSNHCVKPSDESIPRVIVTGFSLFSRVRQNANGEGFNVSGVIAGALGDDHLKFSLPNAANADHLARYSHLEDSDYGGKVRQRVVQIAGQDVAICTIVAEVKWDLAAAIFLEESRRFNPSFVFMSGLASGKNANFEGGALNVAYQLHGYRHSGELAPNNTPVKSPGQAEAPILSYADPEVLREIPMKWDEEALRQSTLTLASSIVSEQGRAIGFYTTAAKRARPSNTYLCNNVAYVLGSAARGTDISLVEGLIRVKSHSSNGPTAGIQELELADSFKDGTAVTGFLHLPDSEDSEKTIKGWTDLYKAVILNVLNL